MKLAAIDIGTNSTRLLISDIDHLAYSSEYKLTAEIREMEISRLGKNIERNGKISAEPAYLTIGVIKRFAEMMDKNKVKKYRAVGTRVLRLAKNADWFVSEVKNITGIDVEIISWQTESELSFTGAVRMPGVDPAYEKAGRKIRLDQNLLVLDIGGGSTEFILGTAKGNIVFSSSVEDGSVSLSEKFLKSEKPDDHELKRLSLYIEKRFADAVKKVREKGFVFMIGLAGTVTTLAAVDLGLVKYDRNKIHGHILRLEEIKKILSGFCKTGYKERRQIAGLDPRRADIIIGGTMILIGIMKMLEQRELIISESDILDGIIYSILQFC